MYLIKERETSENKEEHMAKRVISSAVGIIILILVFIFNNPAIINLAITIIGLIGLSEFYNAFKNKGINAFRIIGYIITLFILTIGYLEADILKIILFFTLPISLFILFCKSIFSKMKYNIIDISVTLLGIVYVSFLTSFLALTRSLEHGQYFIWYILAGAWCTDTFAYLVGVKFGKHKFSTISPKKSIEGCIGGIAGCMLFFGAYTYYLTTIGIELNVAVMTFVGLLISIISQIGDFAASSIKRYCDIKDFGTIMPGHGGVLDRFDSVIMIAPFIYMIFQFIV